MFKTLFRRKRPASGPDTESPIRIENIQLQFTSGVTITCKPISISESQVVVFSTSRMPCYANVSAGARFYPVEHEYAKCSTIRVMVMLEKQVEVKGGFRYTLRPVTSAYHKHVGFLSKFIV